MAAGGLGKLEIRLGRLVVQHEVHEGGIQRPHLATYQQLDLPLLAGIKTMFGAHDENIALGNAGGAGGRDTRSAHQVAVAELYGPCALHELNTVEDAATDEAGTLEGITAVGHQHDGMLALIQPVHDPLVMGIANQVAAHHGGVEVGGIKIDEGFVLGACGCCLAAFRLCADEGLVNFAAGKVQTGDGPLLLERLPAGRFEHVIPHGGRGGFNRIRIHQTMRNGHLAGATHDGLAHHHHGHGGTGNGINILVPFPLAR
jgi:hypothetical protein